MKILLLTKVPESIGRVAVKKEAEARGHQIDFVTLGPIGVDYDSLESLVEKIIKYDVFHAAAGLGEVLTEKVHAMLENTSVYCVNDRGRAAPVPGSKLSQAIRFLESGVSSPRTMRSDQPVYADIAADLGAIFVAKKPQGTKGKAVWLIHNEAELSQIVDGGELIFQEYIESDGDYRVHVVGLDTPFCAYRRLSPPDDFRSNISRGGTAARITDPEEEARVNELAVQAAKAIGLDYCGVDIIRSNVNGGFFVLETNMDPGFLNVEEITGRSFATTIIDYYEKMGGRESRPS